MTLAELLKLDNVKLTKGDRTLFWYDDEWFVSERKYHRRLVTILYRGSSIEEAIKAIMK